MIAANTRGRTTICATLAPPPGVSATVTGARLAGSGRSETSVSSAAAVTKMIGTPYVPARRGRLKISAASPAIVTRFGPTTAPNVEPHTTSPIAVARFVSSYISAAVYRESWLEAFAQPMKTVERRKSGNEPRITAAPAPTAPAAPIP